MYQGEVNVVQEQLASFLTTAELLAVQGLTDGTGKDNDSLVEVRFLKSECIAFQFKRLMKDFDYTSNYVSG